jgi:hypothetical protein
MAKALLNATSADTKGWNAFKWQISANEPKSASYFWICFDLIFVSSTLSH